MLTLESQVPTKTRSVFNYEEHLSLDDLNKALTILGAGTPLDPTLHTTWYAKGRLRYPDVTIFDVTAKEPYLHRWYVLPRNALANVYFHIQVSDDPCENGPHDHRYDSQSTILGGAYIDHEYMFTKTARIDSPGTYKTGAVIRRTANTPHRLEIAPGHRYAMTLFCTGPAYRKWGYYAEDGTFTEANEDYAVTGIATSALQTK